MLPHRCKEGGKQGGKEFNYQMERKSGSAGYRYLGVLKLDTIMCNEMKRKVKEIYQKRVKLLMNIHLNGKHLFQALNTWAISVTRYMRLSWTGQKKRQKNLTVGLENS